MVCGERAINNIKFALRFHPAPYPSFFSPNRGEEWFIDLESVTLERKVGMI